MRFCNVAEPCCGKVTLTLSNVNETCPEFCCVRRCLDVKHFALCLDKTHGRGKHCCPHIHKPLWLLNKPLGLLSGSTCLAICLYSGQMVLKPLSDYVWLIAYLNKQHHRRETQRLPLPAPDAVST